MTPVSKMRTVKLLGHEKGQHMTEPMTVQHRDAVFHQFAGHDAICELPDGTVIVWRAWQVKFTDRGCS